MISYLYGIYINQSKRIMFDGSVLGLNKALDKLNISPKNLLPPMYGRGLIGTEVEKELLSINGLPLIGKEYEKIFDERGVYFQYVGWR